MIIVVGSQSKVKIDAVKDALSANHIDATVIGVKAASSINEQPLNEETLLGARNRAAHARELHAGADFYISIENGIFKEAKGYFDKAVILAVAGNGKEHVQYSEAVKFPTEMVNIARDRGFNTTTVGTVMKDEGLVKDNADPHLDLVGKSRTVILKETISNLFQTMGLGQKPEVNSAPPVRSAANFTV